MNTPTMIGDITPKGLLFSPPSVKMARFAVSPKTSPRFAAGRFGGTSTRAVFRRNAGTPRRNSSCRVSLRLSEVEVFDVSRAVTPCASLIQDRTPSRLFFPSPLTPVITGAFKGLERFGFSETCNWADIVDSPMDSPMAAMPVREEITLMIRNIPNALSRERVFDELRIRDVLKDIDFFYIPGGGAQSKRNVGYCFVNATSHEGADRIRAVFEGVKLGKGDKSCQIAIAKVQGLRENKEAYLSSSAARMEGSFQPLLIENGFVRPVGSDEVGPALSLETSLDMGSDDNNNYTSVCNPELDENFYSSSTVMLRNIPNRYTRDMIIKELTDRHVLKDIDFFYVPIDLRRQHCVGYCFLNITSKDGMHRFVRAFEGLRLDDSTKTCAISLGKVQGLEANIDAYRNSQVMFMNEKYQPMLFREGQQIPFPAPTISRHELRQVKKEKTGVSSRNPLQQY